MAILKPLKFGFIRKNAIGGDSKRQLKIGSTAYNRQLNTIKKSEPETYGKYKAKKGLFDKKFSSLRKYIKNGYDFDNDDLIQVKRILQKAYQNRMLIQIKTSTDTRFNKYYAIKGNNLDDIIKFLKQRYMDVNDNIEFSSNAVRIEFQKGLKDIRLKPFADFKKAKANKAGGLFRYLNESDIDLTKYQIIRKDDDIEIINENCLIYALKQSGLDISITNSVKTHFKKGNYVAKKDLFKISSIINKGIKLYYFDKTDRRRIKNYNKDQFNEFVHIAIYKDHYFILDKTNFTTYASKHYKEIKDIDNFESIDNKVKNTFTRNTNVKCDSLTLIKNLFDQGLFKKDAIELTQDNNFANLNNVNINLDNIENEQRPYNFKHKKEASKAIFYADTETDTSNQHTPILLGVIKDQNNMSLNKVKYYSYDDKGLFFKQFLSYIVKESKGKDKIIVYFHNLKYDYFASLKYFYLKEAPCIKDNQIYSVKILHNKKTIELRDSYKLFNKALCKFQKALDLPKHLNKKEAIAYDYYKKENMNINEMKVEEYAKFLKKEERPIFYQSLKDNFIDFTYDGSTFDPVAYYIHYLKYDCLVLAEGLRKFKKTIDQITENKLSIYDYLTISSLTYSYMGLKGCFNDCYEITGNLRDFCSNAITGGRVQVNEKYKKQVIEKKIADYDGVSLYPSAIRRLCNEKGLVKGQAKQITTTNKNELDRYDYYIVKVKITKINKFQQLPFVSYKDENNSLQYINKIDKPIEVYIDSITLNDYIEFQDIEYEILDGVYWNQGYNKKMGDIIYQLFTARKKYKKEKKQALQEILKLMMNSSYGKTIIKKTNSMYDIRKNEDVENYITSYFHLIKEVEQITEKQTIIKKDCMDDSYNLCHIGVSVLSYSKRIMNEVFNVANDNNLPLYYTDTDSMHCNYDDVKILESKFREKYKKELTGKDLGQFHIDFDLDGAKDEIYATKSIFLGKKCYIDKLESKNENGKIINGLHYRLKGMSDDGLKATSKRKFNGNMFELFTHLIDNELKMPLNPKGYKPKFSYKNNQVFTLESETFTRLIKF